MRAPLIILIILCLAGRIGHASSNSGDSKNYKKVADAFIEQVLFNEETSIDKISEHSKKIDEIVMSFSNKKARTSSDTDFLEHVFYKIHRKYLRQYKPYESFNQLFEKGIYGCLTGTAFYALVLDKLGYDYEIFETNYHIYLMVQSDEGKVLLESTDALNGFVSNSKETEERINHVLEEEKLFAAKNNFSFMDLNHIGFKELVGLQLYNDAVNAYNSQKLGEALLKLDESAKYYPSERITEFLKVIDQSISDSIYNYLQDYQTLNALVVN